MKIVILSVNEDLANIKSKSMVFGSGKNPDPKDVKWLTSKAVMIFVEFFTYKN